MLADDIASSHRSEAYGIAISGAGLTLASIHCDIFKVSSQGVGHDFTHAQGGAGGGVDFVAMMSLDNFDIDIVAQHSGGHIK